MSSLDLVVEKIKVLLANNPEQIFFEAHELVGQEKTQILEVNLNIKPK